jgi:site-specific DNA recombinase
MARNRRDATVYKALFRSDLKIKVYSVTELSEDEDGLAGMLIEGVMELVSEWYSRNLSQETRKGKRERALQGRHNNPPPFGYDSTEKGVLTPNPKDGPAVRLAFELFATGKYYDMDVARMLNEKGFRTKQGKVFSKEMVRPMLQNRTYIGLIKYQVYRKNGNGSRDKKAPTEWIKGDHEPLVDEELFRKCQEIRASRFHGGRRFADNRVYPLAGLIFCGACKGKMTGQFSPSSQKRYYRCRSYDWDVQCPQRQVQAEPIEEQLGQLLMQLEMPKEWQERALAAVDELLNQKQLRDRIEEIKQIIDRLDMRWDMGFMKQEVYIQKREELKAQLAELQPIPQDELIEAHRTLKEFPERWMKGDAEERQRLLNLILARVWVLDDHVCALTLRPNYFVVVHDGIAKELTEDIDPRELPPFVEKEKGNLRVMASCRCGSDGHPSLITICKVLVAPSPDLGVLPAQLATV